MEEFLPPMSSEVTNEFEVSPLIKPVKIEHRIRESS